MNKSTFLRMKSPTPISEARQRVKTTAKNLVAKLSLTKNIKDTQNLVVKVHKLDASELRQMDKSISNYPSPGRSR